ncbi:methyl-accepting chemotaxis protein [Desulfobacterales bacterium HSG2]|nr:methyl-accepting chemotaxis protein [Desulfobacterales bacterium HSG2]
MKLLTKLPMAFLLLFAAIGGTGLFFTGQIRDKVMIFSDTASPMVQTAGELFHKMHESRIATLELLALTDEQKISEQAGILEESDSMLRKTLNRLSRLIAKGNVRLNIQSLEESHQKFFSQVRKVIAAHRAKLLREAAAGQHLENFEKQRKELGTVLTDLANRSDAAINEKEDAGKTLAQSGEATAEEMADLLSELFSQDYFLAKGASKLTLYLIRMRNASGAYLAEKDPEKLPGIAEEFRHVAKLADSRIKKLLRHGKHEADRESLRKIREGFIKLKESVLSEEDGLFAVLMEYRNASSDIRHLKELLASAAGDYELTFREILRLAGELSEKTGRTAKESVRQARRNIGMMIVAGIVIGILSSWRIARSITKPVYELVELANAIAQGDLTQDIKVDRKDEIGQLFRAMKNMVSNFRDIVTRMKGTADSVRLMADNVRSSADRLASVSRKMSTGSEEMSHGTSDQAASTEEASASMEEMASSIRQNADNATQTEKIARKSAGDAREGGEAVLETVRAMREITEKIAIIEKIAARTDLLALNAAIETARAGEHGRRFAVVANETGDLAERCRTAAGDISKISVFSIEVAERAGDMLSRIVPDIQRTADLVQEISAACNEQSLGAEQISNSFQQLDQVIQQNVRSSDELAATAEELASTSEQMFGNSQEMTSQTERLRSAIGYFRMKADATPAGLQAVSETGSMPEEIENIGDIMARAEAEGRIGRGADSENGKPAGDSAGRIIGLSEKEKKGGDAGDDEFEGF